MTSSSSSTTRNLLVPTLCTLKLVLSSSLSSVSPRNQEMSGLGELTSWHSNISRLPSSSCRSCGFCVKLGARSSATPIVEARLRTCLYNETWKIPFACSHPRLKEGNSSFAQLVGLNGADLRHHPTCFCRGFLLSSTFTFTRFSQTFENTRSKRNTIHYINMTINIQDVPGFKS